MKVFLKRGEKITQIRCTQREIICRNIPYPVPTVKSDMHPKSAGNTCLFDKPVLHYAQNTLACRRTDQILIGRACRVAVL